MNKLGKILLASIVALSIAGCGKVTKGQDSASVVTDVKEKEEIIDKVSAVSFNSLANVNMSISAQAKVTIAVLKLSGSYVTSGWGTDNASTKFKLHLDSPMSQDMVSGTGNGKQVTMKTEKIAIVGQTIMDASETTSNSLINTASPDILKVSLIEELAGVTSEDVSEVRKSVSGSITSYYIYVVKAKLENMVRQYGIGDLTITDEPVMGFMMDANSALKGLTLYFNGQYNGMAIEFSLTGTVQ